MFLEGPTTENAFDFSHRNANSDLVTGLPLKGEAGGACVTHTPPAKNLTSAWASAHVERLENEQEANETALSRDGFEIAAPTLRTDPPHHDLAAIRFDEVHTPPAALAAVRAILVARNGFGHVPGQPAGHHGRGCWRGCGRLRRHHGHTGGQAGASGSRAQQSGSQESTPGKDRAVQIDQGDAISLLRHRNLPQE